MSNDVNYRKQLNLILDMLGDSVANETSAHVEEEMREVTSAGVAALRSFEDLVLSAQQTASKHRFEAIKAQLERERRGAKTSSGVVDIATARRMVKTLITTSTVSGGGFMLAARNASAKDVDGLSDNDVLRLYEMARELGRLPDEPK
ncbi:MAG: hypothetical protein ACYC9L_06225 [Sulfuricaulis sp.]